MSVIHWAGTGLSSVPGLRRLIENGHTLKIWNRTRSKAEAAVTGLTGDFTFGEFSLENITLSLKKGDIVVSMLPGELHVPLAKICLEKNAHFVSSSYISDEMRALSDEAKSKALCFVNEVGLDPGIDHLMAHVLVANYKNSEQYSTENEISFLSYCGGLSKVKNDFCYKFSWSPLGVLKALKSPSRSIKAGKVRDVARPWHAVESYNAPIPNAKEAFEVYPNRDSLPFMSDYQFGENWNVKNFVRGTLRFQGWSSAWKSIFDEVDTTSVDKLDARLVEISKELEEKHSYSEGEYDRVVLCVDLKAEHSNATVWHKTYVLNAYGNDKSSAMARLVSIPVSLAVESILHNNTQAGVSAAPSDIHQAKKWLTHIEDTVELIEFVDNLE